MLLLWKECFKKTRGRARDRRQRSCPEFSLCIMFVSNPQCLCEIDAIFWRGNDKPAPELANQYWNLGMSDSFLCVAFLAVSRMVESENKCFFERKTLQLRWREMQLFNKKVSIRQSFGWHRMTCHWQIKSPSTSSSSLKSLVTNLGIRVTPKHNKNEFGLKA